MHAGHVGPRGRGQQSPAARYVWPLAIGFLALTACGERNDRSDRADNSVRTVVSAASGACTTLPDTAGEWAGAQPDRNDLPVTQLVLTPECPRVTVAFRGGPYIERTYKVNVPAGRTLVARARSDSSDVALAFDFPTAPKADRSDLGLLRVDSLTVSETREVAVRVRLTPKLREQPQTARVLLTVLVRP
jgi:hypothetical protein